MNVESVALALVEIIRKTSGKILIVDAGAYAEAQMKYKIDRINIECLKPLEDYKYNFHDRFRSFGISKREKFRTIKVCRKK